MKTFEQWKIDFDKNVTPEDIKVDWDCGHAYHYIESSHFKDLSDEDEDMARDYVDEWTMKFGPTLYCCPYIAELDKLYDRACDECADCLSFSQLIHYTEGYLHLLERQREPETEFIVAMKQWVVISKLLVVA